MRISDWISDVCSSDLEFGILIFGGKRARRRHRGFLVAREQQDDRPLRLEAVLFQLRHRRDHHRDVKLVVLRPAAENKAIFLDRTGERREGKEGVSKCGSRWETVTKKTKKKKDK